ncbi:hypothetical protein COT97_05015 [Candidatus Falkowbacteria bacterium CG10_big_fil_rev_8_21_14_0_10_39_11]|uniref:YdbS-like PH domain-containing protein n=1 Tax=Candidatus Falkowbacteria bacterium CG10_big_fil_rev_8_21_14_0_10_39_11 TaxID=1974565 RepID=A0A2H0V3Y4_9BACT|nr:MAG: hypothetical protein COT97_05015 [Candidatus Falkowbacteria bacterium CG10_big_fil_rev_8_21_14_0_10_39_11]
MYSKHHFPNQKPNEQVLMFFRRHWIVVAKILLLSLIITTIPIIFYLFFARTYTFLENDMYRGVYILFNSAYALFVILFTFSNFIDYYLDVWIVTNMRVINIEQKGLFSREMSEKELGRMQDITSEVTGFLATVLGFGDVHIQTAGEEQRFVFKQIPDAEEVTRKISNLAAEYRAANPDEDKAEEIQ